MHAGAPGEVKLAYLLNTYPVPSGTFIRREIAALEAQGQPVKRFAVRRWEGELVDPADRAEQDCTEYLLDGNAAGLLRSALAELANLPRLLALFPLWLALLRRGGGLVRHVAYLLEAIHFRRRAALLGIGHVHSHFSTNAAAVAVLAHRLGGPSYSFTVHGPDELVDPKRNYIAAKAAHAAFIVAISDYCRGRILAEIAPEDAAKVRIIRCGLRLADFTPAPPDPAGRHRLVCVGRLCANKGQHLLPAAVAAIRDEFPELVVELIGDGETRGQIEREIERQGMGRNFILSGWLDNQAVRERIRAARALMLPSFAEGLPIVIMEAMASGRPVLSTRIAGIPELVDDGSGWIVPPGDHDALVEALRALLRAPDAEIEAKAAEGRNRVERRHDVDASARALIVAFREARVQQPA